MDLSSNIDGLAPVLVALLAVGIVAAFVSLVVIAQFVVTSRRERVALHESIPTYYRRLALSH